ncbi:MAG: hypothetical protein ACC608_02385 [Anaerofustis sp.]
MKNANNDNATGFGYQPTTTDALGGRTASDNANGHLTITQVAQRSTSPRIKSLTATFLMTYIILPIGLVLIASIPICGIILDYVYIRYTLSAGTTVFAYLSAAASIYGYVMLSVNLLAAFKEDAAWKRASEPTSTYQSQSVEKAKRSKFLALLIALSAIIAGLSVWGLIVSIPLSGEDLTVRKIIFVILIIIALTAPVIELMASAKARRKNASKLSVPSLFQYYLKKMQAYDDRTAVDYEVVVQIKRKQTDMQPNLPRERDIPVQEETVSYAINETIDQRLSVLQQGFAFAKEIDKANARISDHTVAENLNAICGYVKDIFSLASRNENIEKQIRKFGNIYLPKTLRLCNLYLDMDGKRNQTDEVKRLKEQIGKSIENAKYAFSNLNDNLIRQSSIDIEAEIQSFESILTIDGLLSNQEMVMPKQDED